METSCGRTRNFDLTEALDLATREFWERDMPGQVLDDLTEAMGIARPSLYRAFGNKEQLFGRVVEHFEKIYLDFVDDALATHPVQLVVQRLLEGTVRACAGPSTPQGSLLTHGAPASSPEDEAIQKLLSTRIDIYQEKLAGRLGRASAPGELPADTDCRAMAAFVITHCCGMALRVQSRRLAGNADGTKSSLSCAPSPRRRKQPVGRAPAGCSAMAASRRDSARTLATDN